MEKPQRTAIKAPKKPRKKTASRSPLPTWIYFVAVIATPVTVEFLIPRHWAHFPWVVGPIAWMVTILAVIWFMRSLITRKGLTIGSLGSCMAIAAFTVASAVYLLAPPIGPLFTLLLAQVSATIMCIMLALPLRRVQLGMDPMHRVEIRPFSLDSIGQWLVRALPVLVLWNGLTLIFYNTPCSNARCEGGEALFGVHGPFSNIYLAAYFGMMAFASPVLAMFQALRRRMARPDTETPQ